VSDQDRAAVRSLLEPGDWLLLQNEINDLPAALTLARDTGAKVALNLAPVDGRESDYDLASVDLLIVNEIESRALVPSAVADADDGIVASWLADAHPGMEVVLTSGAEGLVHAGSDGVRKLAAYPARAVDETAAGDAFIGYLLAGLLEGRALPEALSSGAAAGALAVTVAGAASSIPRQEEVVTLMKTSPQTLRASPVTS
jgi:ribokinase